jgi:hypothetical protein
MAAKGQFYATAYRHNIVRKNKAGEVVSMSGGLKSLGRSKTNFTSVESAIKGLSSLVTTKDGANIAYIHGPGLTTQIITL